MKHNRRAGWFGLMVCGLSLVPCHGVVMMQIRLSGTSDTFASVSPGAVVNLDVVAVSITAGADTLGNLDAFTYRITFPNQDFGLEGSAFSAPFDNQRPGDLPPGFNGSIPWGGPTPITFGADAGSPGATLLVPDLYRTTATESGLAATGNDVVLETLSIRVPTPPAGTLPAGYAINLNVLEAVDNFGSFHATDNGVDFVLTVVPEPGETVLMAGMGLLAVIALRRRLASRA